MILLEAPGVSLVFFPRTSAKGRYRPAHLSQRAWLRSRNPSLVQLHLSSTARLQLCIESGLATATAGPTIARPVARQSRTAERKLGPSPGRHRLRPKHHPLRASVHSVGPRFPRSTGEPASGHQAPLLLLLQD